MAEQACNVIYKLAEHPDIICADIVRQLAAIIMSYNQQGAAPYQPPADEQSMTATQQPTEEQPADVDKDQEEPLVDVDKDPGEPLVDVDKDQEEPHIDADKDQGEPHVDADKDQGEPPAEEHSQEGEQYLPL